MKTLYTYVDGVAYMDIRFRKSKTLKIAITDIRVSFTMTYLFMINMIIHTSYYIIASEKINAFRT